MCTHILYRAWLKEEKERKVNLTNEIRLYWESRIEIVVGEIEKFKLDELILKNVEERKQGKQNTNFVLSYEELEEIKANHATTNMVQLNSKLDSAKKELDYVLEKLESFNAPFAKSIEDQYILPPSPGTKDFKVIFRRKIGFGNTIKYYSK